MRRINNPNIYKLSSMFMFMITILVIFTSIGYSALSSSLMISGEAYVRVIANVRITNVTWLESNNQGYETYNSEYYKEGIKVFATLPNIDSSITYKIEITNNTDIIYIIDGINELINSNELMTYTIENIDKDILNKQVTTFNITIKYKDTVTEVPSNNMVAFELKFDLEIKDVTPPVLTVNESGYSNFEDGTIIYYDVLTGKPCTNYHEDNSLTNYNGTSSTKTTDNQNSCLKFYAFNYDVGDSKVNLLLDHNTTAVVYWTDSSTESNENGPINVIEQLKIDTDEWVGTITPENYTVSQEIGGNYTIDYSDYKARLITANEIAEITVNTSFNENTTRYSNWFYFDTTITSSSDTCKYGNTTGCSYGWLYDRTRYNCENFGCFNNAESDYSSMYGYWTSTSASGISSMAWCVGLYGSFYDDSVNNYDRSIRPVIEVSKTKLKKEIVITAYDNESGLSSDNNYKYYLSTSSTELVDGEWTNYTSGKSFTITEETVKYLWVYPIKDNAGNVNDNKTDINDPYVYKLYDTINVFAYTGSEQTFTVPETGYYKLETWGAQGGTEMADGVSKNIGGYGGYSYGTVYLNKGQILYLNVGGKGEGAKDIQTGGAGGYNGGGIGGTDSNYSSSGENEPGAGGGGATHIATSSGLLSTLSSNVSDILIVAGAGGGGAYSSAGGHGGGISGNVGGNSTTTGGAQTSGNGFGLGGAGSSYTGGSGAGGSGYYGGIGGTADGISGAGGSGYIGNTLLTNKAMYCYNCTESSDTSTKTISTTNVSSNAISNYAKSGNGYAKITYIGDKSISASGF